MLCTLWCLFFFFNDTATTEIYTLSLHDALPIWRHHPSPSVLPFTEHSDAAEPRTVRWPPRPVHPARRTPARLDRKSTRLNSSHGYISYAVFCLKKKKKKTTTRLAQSNYSNATLT